MTLRATRQYVEALGPGSGKARATRQYVEVLSPPPIYLEDATDILGLTHSASVVLVRCGSVDRITVSHVAKRTMAQIRSAEHTLGLTEQASVIRVAFVAAEDTLSLADVTDGIASKSVDHTLALTDAASVLIAHIRTAQDTLALTQRAIGAFSYNVSARDTLHLTERVRGGIFVGAVTDLLQQPLYSFDPITGQLITTYQGLRDRADVAIIHGTPFVARDTISLSEKVLGVAVHADAIACEVTDSLGLSDASVVGQWPFYRDALQAGDRLFLAQTAEAVVVKVVQQSLALTQTATFTMSRLAAIEDDLTVSEAVAFIIVSRANVSRYHPFIGVGASGAPTPPAVSIAYDPATIAPVNTFFDPDNLTDAVTLRSAELGNKDRLQFTRISRETRGGTLIVFADPTWPKVQTQVLTFTALTQDQARGLLDFLAAHLGEEIGFIDWELRQWRGIITNPSDAVVQDGRRMYTANVELEGELVT